MREAERCEYVKLEKMADRGKRPKLHTPESTEFKCALPKPTIRQLYERNEILTYEIKRKVITFLFTIGFDFQIQFKNN